MGVKVREKKPGEWWVFVTHKGKRTSRKVGSEEAAQEVGKTIEAKLTLKQFVVEAPQRKEEQTPTYEEYATVWLEDQIKTLRRESTYIRYKELLKRHVFPVIGKLPLDQVKRSHVKKMLLDYSKQGHTKRSVALLRDIANGPFAAAVDDELIQSSPITGVLKRLGIKPDNKPPVDPLTAEETALLLETCREHYPEYHPMFLLMLRTGVRLGEALALKWSDVDWNSRFIQVARSYRRRETSGTKTGKTRRVDISDQLLETLKSLYIQRKREVLSLGLREVDGIIFHNGKGKSRGQNSVRYIFKKVLMKAGLRNLRPHDMRHSYASQLLSDGVTPVYVKNQLGHHSIEITVDIYGHWIPSGNQEAVNRLDQMAKNCTQSAPSPHPTKNETAKLLKTQPLL
jgi:integrase